MKKKLIYLFILFIITITTTTGCFNNDQLEGAKITTTVYPIEYIVERLYGYNSTITSIYPNDTKVEDYKLTEKRLNDFSDTTNLFIYNGLSNEKEIARTLSNKNKKLQIIDVSYGLKYKYGVEELWLHPNNCLMLANTIKEDLKDLSSSKYAAEKIEENYSKLEEDLTSLDAQLRNIAKISKNNNNTIIIAYNSFGFLENYGFNILNISSDNNITQAVKKKFKDGTYNQILVANKEDISDSVKDLVDNYNVELIEINTMSTLTDQERNNNDDYLSIMNDFITKISNIALAE